MNKLKFSLNILLSLLIGGIGIQTLTSCSDGGDDGPLGGGGPITETYTLKGKTDSQFTYVEEEEYYSCEDGGILETRRETDEETIYYSIENNTLTWENKYSDDDTLNFKGTSRELVGTWTRTKNKAAACRISEYDDTYKECKEGYDITQAVFTNTTVAITRDECFTDEIVDGSTYYNYRGWKVKIIDCNTIEISKGAEKITVKETRTSEEVSYKGKSCKASEPSKSQSQAACQKAWNEYQDEYYWEEYYYEFLYADFDKCVKGLNLPPEFYEDDDEGDYYDEKIYAKPAAKAKAKFIASLKKKK